jgi:hypothetical protein
MSDEVKRNLEPIEERDLNLEKKFSIAGVESGNKSADLPKKEIPVAKEISGAEKDVTYSDILSKVQVSKDDDNKSDDVSVDAEKVYDAEMDAKGQVQKLVSLAMDKGVVHAVKVARHLEDNYVLDTFHDQLLAEEFHNALLEKGLIK